MADKIVTDAKAAASSAVTAVTPVVQKEETAFNRFITKIRWPLIAFGAGAILGHFI
jgi:hypothetical protein